jgi:hypothetical protein
MKRNQLAVIILMALGVGYKLGSMNPPSEKIVIKTVLKSKSPKEIAKECDVAIPGGKEKREEAEAKDESSETKPTSEVSRRAQEISHQGDVKEFLKQVEKKDFFEELKSAKQLTDEQLRILNGNYAGQVQFDEGEKENWDMELRLNGYVQNDLPQGDKLVVLSKRGKVFSRNTGKGKLKGISVLENDPNSFLVEVNGDDGYVQMYYLPRMDEFAGIYYEKINVGQFERNGTVTLKRSYNNASY